MPFNTLFYSAKVVFYGLPGYRGLARNGEGQRGAKKGNGEWGKYQSRTQHVARLRTADAV
jgi:hypothetical protein